MLRALALSLILTASALAPARADVTLSEGSAPFACPPGHAVASIGCSGAHCDDISLTCRPVLEDAPLTFWTHWFESGGRRSGACTDPAPDSPAPRDAFFSGLACRGDHCGDIAMHCTASFGGRIDRQNCETVQLNDAEPVQHIPEGRIVAMIGCSGAHCDSKEITICPYDAP